MDRLGFMLPVEIVLVTVVLWVFLIGSVWALVAVAPEFVLSYVVSAGRIGDGNDSPVAEWASTLERE